MKKWQADTIVVGVGIWGASAMWALASRGHDVLGIERFRPGHGFGSSVGGSRMFRLTCLEHPGLVPLARRSLQLWRRLEQQTGTSLLHQSGALLIGPADGHIVGGTLRAADVHGIDVEILGLRELRRRFPRHAALPPDDIGVWEPSAGLLRAELSVRAAATAATAAGARLMTDTRVLSVEPVEGGVAVRTPAGDLYARRAVLTVGSWLSTFTSALPLSPVRFPVTWFQPQNHHAEFELQRLPVFMRELPDGTVLWGNGRENGHEVKLGVETRGRETTPFDLDVEHRTVDAADWQSVADLVPRFLPGLSAAPSRVAVSMISETPDGQFALGFLDSDHRILAAGGCNGHGFKHAPGVGEAIATILSGENTQFDIGFTMADRFVADDVGSAP